MASIVVKHISSLCKLRMHCVLPFLCTKNANHCLNMYVYIEHTAFCVSMWYGSELRMRIIQTFECWQQSSDNCLRIFVHGNMQLPWVMHTQLLPFSRTCFCVVLAGGMLVLHPATEHCGQHYDCNRNACILIQGRKHANSDSETSHVACVSYTMMKSVSVYFDGCHL